MSGGEDAPIDLDYLKRNVGSRADISEILDMYVAQTALTLRTIEAAADEENFAQLREAAHSIKSGSLNLGAKGILDLVLPLERMETNISLARERVVQLRVEFVRVCAYIVEYKKSMGDS